MPSEDDRWATEFRLSSGKQPSIDKTAMQKKNNTGIDPTGFHKKKRSHDDLSQTEKSLFCVLQLASKNEVVQKRKIYTTVQKAQLEEFESVTNFRIFPLQDLAIEFLDEMTKQYLGDGTQQCSGSQNLHRQSELRESLNERINCGPEMKQPREKFLADCIQEMNFNPLSSHSIKSHEFLPPLWSMEPRIFALETSCSGKRKYIVGNLGRFMNHYWRKSDPLNRHYYELIRESTPCRLYFDLEYCKLSNSQISDADSEVLMTEFIYELCYQFRQVYGITLTRSSIVDLDSSTSKKFSRHLIVHLPNGELFADAQSAGSFAKQFLSRLADEMASGMLVGRHQTLARNLFVNTKPGKDPSKRTCFVDLGVYTRNRLFRLLGSSKFGKPAAAALRIADANEFNFPPDFGNSNFYVSALAQVTTSISTSISDHDQFCRALQWEKHADALAQTLVVPVNASKIKYPILSPCTINDGTDKINSAAAPRSKMSSVSLIANRPTTTSMKSNGQSPIPKLDVYILSTVGQRGGVQGRIRAWSIEYIENLEVFYLTYQMCDNRWCERIGRQHRSNNIMWTVDLKDKTCWQSCHDSDCREFRGSVMPLALLEDIVAEIDEFIFDKELEQLDEGRIIQNFLPPEDDEFDNPEMDKALSEVDMARFTPTKTDKDEFDNPEMDQVLCDVDMASLVPTNVT